MEVWPLLGDGMPALAHETVDRAGAVVGRLEAAAVGHELHDLLVPPAGIRHVAERHHLPQEDTEGPGERESESV